MPDSESPAPYSCVDCISRARCLPGTQAAAEVHALDQLIGERSLVRQGEKIYDETELFPALYAVHTGAVATSALSWNGTAVVTGYYVRGEVFGEDLFYKDHRPSAVAATDAVICVIDFERLQELARKTPWLQQSLFRLLGQKVRRNRISLARLRSTNAEKRIRLFVHDLAARHCASELPQDPLILHISRAQIASYLGLRTETVCRVIKRLRETGEFDFRRRMVVLRPRLAPRNGTAISP